MTPVFVLGLTRKQEDEGSPVTLTAEKILTLDEVVEKCSEELHIHLYEETDMDRLKDFFALLKKYPSGDTKLILCVHTGNASQVFIEASARYRVKVSCAMLEAINAFFGAKRWKIKTDDSNLPQPRPKFDRSAWKENKENSEESAPQKA